ncbi:MAG: magnesium transporter [Pseudomonadota bacterium]
MADVEEKEVEPGDVYALNTSTVDALLAAVEVDAADQLSGLLADLHAADIADLLEQIGPAKRQQLLSLWGTEVAGDVLAELEEGVRDEVLAALAPEQLAAAVQEMETDDVVYLVEDLEAPQQAEVLDALDRTEREAVTQALAYPDESAGRLMQREVVTAPEHWTVGDAIDFMRASDDLPDEFYHLIVVDPRLHPVAKVSLGRIMSHPRATPISELHDDDFRPIPVDQTEEDVAYAFNQYHLISAPVVDAEGRLVGVITIDDAMAVLEDAAEEDMKRLAGLGDEELEDTVWKATRARFPWLAVNLVTAILASMVIDQFSATIAALVALAVLMPIVASMGGNAGTQTLTVAVRALATRDLTPANALRIIRREALVGLLNGVAFAVIIGVVGAAWFGSPALGLVLAAAMVVNLLIAGLAGILIPMGLERVGADPALASGAFVTTVTDVVGFFAFLGLAAVVLL